MNSDKTIYLISNDSLFASAFVTWLGASFKNRVIAAGSVNEYLKNRPETGDTLFLHVETFEADACLLLANQVARFKRIFVVGYNAQHAQSLAAALKTNGFIHLAANLSQLATEFYNAITTHQLPGAQPELAELSRLLHKLRFEMNSWNLDENEVLLLQLLQKDTPEKQLATAMKLPRWEVKQMQVDIAKKFEISNSKNLLVQHAISLGILNLEENDVHPLTSNLSIGG